MNKKNHLLLLLALFLVMWSACNKSTNVVPTNYAKTQVSFSISAKPQSNSTCRVVISGTDMDTIGPNTYEVGQLVELYVPEGPDRKFYFERYNKEGDLTDTGTSVMNIGQGMNEVEVTMVQLIAPHIDTQPLDLTVTEGGTATFFIEAQGTDLQYQWQKNNVDIEGANDSAYTIETVTLTDGVSTFRCILKNAVDEVTSESARLTVTEKELPPVVTVQPENQTITEGESAVFSIQAQGTELFYQWQRDSADISDATSATYTLSSVSMADSGSMFRCIVSNSVGDTFSNEAMLIVTRAVVAPQIAVHPKTQTVTEGQLAEFAIEATGTDLSYQWQRDSIDIDGAMEATYIIPEVTLADSGAIYRCIVKNSAETVSSDAAALIVLREREIVSPTIKLPPASQKATAGSKVSFSVEADGTDLKYQWFKGNTAIDGETGSFFTIDAVTPAEKKSRYQVIVYNDADSITSEAAELNVIYTVTYKENGKTSGTAPSDTGMYEEGEPVRAMENTGGLERTGHIFEGWKTSLDESTTVYDPGATLQMGTESISFYPVWIVDTFVVAFNSNGGSAVDTQRVPYDFLSTEPGEPQKGGYDFDGWYVTEALTGVPFDFATQIITNRTLHAKWVPVYTVSYHANGGTGTVPTDTNAYRSDEPVTVKEGNLERPGYRFVGWNTTAEGTGVPYRIFDTFRVGNADVDLYAQWTIKAPEIEEQPQAHSAYEGESVTFTVKADGINLEYQWQKDGNNIGGANDSFYTVTDVSTADTGFYSCVISNDGGDQSTGDVKLTLLTTVTDVDGNVYNVVRIGNQLWTVENLRTTMYNDSTEIPHVPDSAVWDGLATGAYCYMSNTTNYEAIRMYGALYNWFVVQTGKLAPTGWRVPTDLDWTKLEEYLITSGHNWDGSTRGNKIGKALASTTNHWSVGPNAGDIGNDRLMNNSTGFSAHPAGMRGPRSGYCDRCFAGYWWSSTEYDASDAYIRILHCDGEALDRTTLFKKWGFSVRLVRDLD